MFADLDIHNRAEVLEMARADRKAAEGWRFRNHKGKTSKGFVTILTALIAFFVG